MEILFVTPSIDEADVVGNTATALPKLLRARGHNATVISPLYAQIDPTTRSLARRLTKLDVTIDGVTHACTLYDGRTARGVQLLFIGNDELFGKASDLDSADVSVEVKAIRAAVFARAVCELVKAGDRKFDAVHAFGWSGALALAALHEAKSAEGKPAVERMVLTLLDTNERVLFSGKTASKLGFKTGADSEVDVIALGVAAADSVTLPSASMARAAAENGKGAAQAFAALGSRLRGVPVGIDPAVWNPATDPIPASRFDPIDLRGKAACKRDIQQFLQLPVRADAPLLGLRLRKTSNEILDLFASIAADVLRNDCQVAIVAEAGPDRQKFDDLAATWGDRLKVAENADAQLDHRLFAGVDLFLVGSPNAAATFDHFLAQRYGALPIALASGGFADDIVDADAQLTTGTGFLFTDVTAESLLGTVRRGFAGYARPEAFVGRQATAMRVDHTWDRSVRIYETLYRAEDPIAEQVEAAAAPPA